MMASSIQMNTVEVTNLCHLPRIKKVAPLKLCHAGTCVRELLGQCDATGVKLGQQPACRRICQRRRGHEQNLRTGRA